MLPRNPLPEDTFGTIFSIKVGEMTSRVPKSTFAQYGTVVRRVLVKVTIFCSKFLSIVSLHAVKP